VSFIGATNVTRHGNAACEAIKTGDWTTARNHWAKALANAQSGGAPIWVLTLLNYEYGRALGVTCLYDEAEKYLLKALDLDLQSGAPTGMSLVELARLQYDQKEYERAIPYFRRAVEAIETAGVAAKLPIDFADLLNEYAEALIKTGDSKVAIALGNRARQLRTDNPDKQSKNNRTPYGTQCAN
jgi:tetratricopeptide (TPR) repeat protein